MRLHQINKQSELRRGGGDNPPPTHTTPKRERVRKAEELLSYMGEVVGTSVTIILSFNM